MQWLFIIEGVPSILLGIVTWFYPTDRPERADWLSAGQKAWLASKLDAGIAAKQAVKRMTLGEALSSPKVFALSLIAALPLIAGLLVLFGGRESKAEFADSGKVA